MAIDLFSISGYEATSISQIADAVGLRKASLYSHFASKQDILDTLIDELTKFRIQRLLHTRKTLMAVRRLL